MAQPAPSKFQGVSTFGPLPPTKRGYGLHVNYGALNEKIDGKSVLKEKICYGAGLLAIVRDVENINQLTTFNGHQGKVTCVSPAPNGNWVASGDDTGVVHVWSYPFLTLKNTVRIGNTINELRWTTDSAMILAAGNGSNEFAKAFRFDAQNPLGKIDRIVKQALSADWSPIKPHRVVVTTEDNEVLFYHGVPFKYDSCTRLHTRYPNCVRFSPDGKYFASVGSDSQIILYNGQTGEKVGELKDDNGHKGSILSVAWKADSTELATASADKTIKVWNVAEGKVVHTWTSKLYNSVEDQQASVMWPAKSDPISVGISGAISFWSRSQEDPVQVVQGHHSSIISRAFNRANGTLYSGDLEGRLIATDVKTGSVISYSGAGHGQTPLCAVTIGPDNTVYTAGYDQTVQKHNPDYKFGDIVAKVPANVKSMVATKDALVVAMASDIYTYNPSAMGEPIQKEKFSADRLVLSPCGAKVYAVSASAKAFRVYALSANGLTLENTVNAEFTAPQDVAVGPTGQVFSCEATQVIPWKADYSGPVAFGWEYHTGQITSLSVSPGNKYAASVANDRILTVWMDMENLKGNKNAVFRAQETFVFVDFVDDETLLVVTQDNLIKTIALKL